MNECIFIKPDISMKKSIWLYREEMLRFADNIDGAGSLKEAKNVTEWLEMNHKLECKNTIPNDWVESEQFVYLRENDKKIVGMLQFRHYLNDFLKKYGGHIGYSVIPSERCKGYATKMLAEGLCVCKKRKLDRILITCRTGNIGSQKVILANDGVYEKTVFCKERNMSFDRYWIELS